MADGPRIGILVGSESDRERMQSATALLATGQTGTPLRALIWLTALQRAD